MKLKTLIKKIEECYSEREQDFWCEIPAGLDIWILKYLKEYQNWKEFLNDR